MGPPKKILKKIDQKEEILKKLISWNCKKEGHVRSNCRVRKTTPARRRQWRLNGSEKLEQVDSAGRLLITSIGSPRIIPVLRIKKNVDVLMVDG